MRAILAATIALGLAAPAAAATTTTDSFNAIHDMVSAYSGLQSVRVVEHFDNGPVATVDIMPGGQYRIAESGGEDPALVVRLATQPADGAETVGTDQIASLGNKTVDGVPARGYKITAPDGTYTETVWIDAARNLPIQASVQTQGHNVSLDFGNYNATPMVATQIR